MGKKKENTTTTTSSSSLEHLSIKDISKDTGIKMEDLISTLQYLDMIRCWKGQHVVYVQQAQIQAYLHTHQAKKLRLCKPEHLDWDPLSTTTTTTTTTAPSSSSSSSTTATPSK